MHEAVPGDRERRARATRASRADGPLTETSAIDAALAGADKLRLRFGHISDAVFATDATNRITHWTDSAERLFGYSAAEAVGRPCSWRTLCPSTGPM
jgi:PAS domain-containing protein